MPSINIFETLNVCNKLTKIVCCPDYYTKYWYNIIAPKDNTIRFEKNLQYMGI